jgi:hypothetical protein
LSATVPRRILPATAGRAGGWSPRGGVKAGWRSAASASRPEMYASSVGPGLDLIVGPAATDAHPDHRAVATALGRGFGEARRLSYHVWPPRAGATARAKTLSMRGGHAAKRSLLRLYRTQLGAITDDPTGFAIARHELAAFAHPLETFVEVRR